MTIPCAARYFEVDKEFAARWTPIRERLRRTRSASYGQASQRWLEGTLHRPNNNRHRQMSPPLGFVPGNVHHARRYETFRGAHLGKARGRKHRLELRCRTFRSGRAWVTRGQLSVSSTDFSSAKPLRTPVDLCGPFRLTEIRRDGGNSGNAIFTKP